MSEQQYDPTAEGQTVTKVAEHLADADQTEVERVLAAESAGQDREGVRKAAYARLEAIAAANAPEVKPDPGDGTTPKLDTTAPTLAEQAETAVEAEDQATRQGYHGAPPSLQGDNPVDLTLAGVTGQARTDG